MNEAGEWFQILSGPHEGTWHLAGWQLSAIKGEPTGRNVDRELARDEMGTPCRSCLEDWGHCQCAADCGGTAMPGLGRYTRAARRQGATPLTARALTR